MELQTTLTEIEMLGLSSPHNLADGHAYQDLAPSQAAIIRDLPRIWMESAARKVPEAEFLYKTAFADLAGSLRLKTYRHFRVCPTASNSIDTVAAWLAEKKMTVALIEPTFDNLYLLLKRRGVPVSSFPESDLDTKGVKATFDGVHADAVFLVNPNNPTGRTLTEAEFRQIVQWCAENKKTLLLDNTFRFFVAQSYDQYAILLDSGVTFISIEDTGKVWPTQDLKVSLLFFSADIAAEVNLLYEEIYLCISNFALGILTEFLRDAHARGLDQAVWAEVTARQALFDATIDGTALSLVPGSASSRLSVRWLEIDGGAGDDVNFVRAFHKKGIVLLPGRNFFWNHPAGQVPRHFVRASLLKPKAQFLDAIGALRAELQIQKGAADERVSFGT